MSATAKWMIVALVSAVLLVAGGWWLCHAQGVSAAQTAADSAAVQQHRADSVAAELRWVITSRDSLARADSARAETLTRQQVQERLRRLMAESAVVQSQAALGQAQTAADSLPIYRDSLVPALQSTTASLGRELAASDSSGQAWKAGYAEQVQKVAALETIHRGDSDVIASQRLALDKAARAPVASKWLGFIPAPHLKPCGFSGVTTKGELRFGVGACVTL